MPAEGDEACRACGSPVPSSARFCATCGAATSVDTCGTCGGSLPPGAHFCPGCGTEVGAPAAAAGPVAERRMTTILFADLVGFTPIAESLDADDARELLSHYFAECRVIIARYAGTVEKFIGDAVMAVWGVPQAHEDDAERAVRAGLELTAAIARLGPKVGVPGLAMRVGIVTGEVAVTLGAIGEGMVAGDNVNTAARVQSVAQPGQVWTDDVTRSLAARAIDFSDVGAHDLKGKAEPLHLWHAMSVLPHRSVHERIDGLHAPLTGRDSELRLLTELFHATERARRPRLVVLDGDPGVGKSRLAAAFEEYVDHLPQDVRWHLGRCISYGDGVAFWALAEAARGRLGLVEAQDASPEQLDHALAAFVPDPAERQWMQPRIAALLGLGPVEGFARESLFDAWTTFFERVGGEHDAVVIVIDDAQYADQGLLAFIEHVLVAAQAPILILALARPELLIRRPDLGGRRATYIRLNPFDDSDMATLVDALVDGVPAATRDRIVARAEGVPLFAVETVRALVDAGLVVPRDGRYVVADGADVDVDALGPTASLQAVIAARLDALDPDERRVVVDASVLGLAFPRDALATLGLPAERVDAALTSLERREIIKLQQDRLSSERGQYRFVQSLVRQVAYSLLTKRDRKARHLAVADFLQSRGDANDDVSVVIAQHLMDAVDNSSPDDTDVDELNARACEMLIRAADRARALGAIAEAWRLDLTALERSSDERQRAVLHQLAAKDAGEAGLHQEAVEHGQLAMAAFDALGEPIEAGLAAAWTGLALEAIGEPAQALLTVRPRFEELDGQAGAEVALLHLARTIGLVTIRDGGRDEALPALQRQLVLAEGLADQAMISDAQMRLGVFFSKQGAPQTWRALTRSAVQLAAEGGHLQQHAEALMNLGVLLLHDDPSEAMVVLEEAMVASRRSGVASNVDFARLNYALGLWLMGRLAETRAVLDDLESDVTDVEISLSCVTMRAWLGEAANDPMPEVPEVPKPTPLQQVELDGVVLAVQSARGEFAAATETALAAMPRLTNWFGLHDDFVHFWPPLVLAAVRAGNVEAAEALLQPVTSALAGRVNKATHAQMLRLRGLVGALRGDPDDDVEADLLAGVEALTRMRMASQAACARGELGSWLISRGRVDDGMALLDGARAELTALGAFGWRDHLAAPVGQSRP